MKKKFISGLLLMALTAGGFSTFTSCKDTNEDVLTEIKGQQATLQAALDALNKKLSECQTNCGTEIQRLENLINSKPHFTEAEIKGWISQLTSQYALQSALQTLEARVKALEEAEPVTPVTPEDPQFTPEQVATLITLINKADELTTLLATVNGEDGLSEQVKELQKAINGEGGIADQIKALQTLLNGDATTPGLLKTVEGLEEWFNGIGITPAEFQQYVKQGEWVITNQVALNKIIVKLNEIEKLNGTAIDALNQYYTDFSKISEMYNTLFPNGTAGQQWWSYAQVMQNIQTNSSAITKLQNDINTIFNRLNDMVTSLVLQAATNCVYPSFSTPFGLNSMVLMTYFGEAATPVEEFPASMAFDMGAEMYANYNIDWSSILSSAYQQLPNSTFAHMADNGEATLGSLWFTVNPGTVNNLDKTGFSIVNSKEESNVNLINVHKDDDTLFKFGVNGSGSRAEGNGNGLYVGEATVSLENLDNIKINIEKDLALSLKDAVKNRKAADMMHLLQALYGQVQDLCDANALRYTYNAVTGKDANGAYITEPSKVYTNYGLAATAFKPLSFATLKGTSIRHIPNFGKIELDKSLVDLKLKPFKIGNVTLNINLKIDKIEIGDAAETIITVKIPSKYDVNVDNSGVGEATLPEGWDENPDLYSTITVDITDDLQAVVNSIKASIDEWINGVPGNEDKPGLNAQINNAIKQAVDDAFNGPNGLVTSIENQVNGMMGDIQDKLNDLVDKINKDYIGKVNTLINKYNSVADRINNALDDPNHYLQAVMFYQKADGGLGFISTDSKQPSQFKGNGEAIELIATTYNFEVVCPVFLKVVGVTKVTDQNGNENTALKDAANASMAKVVDGGHNRFALDVKGAQNGVFTYEIAYQALDYSGYTSTVKTYIQVVRK